MTDYNIFYDNDTYKITISKIFFDQSSKYDNENNGNFTICILNQITKQIYKCTIDNAYVGGPLCTIGTFAHDRHQYNNYGSKTVFYTLPSYRHMLIHAFDNKLVKIEYDNICDFIKLNTTTKILGVVYCCNPITYNYDESFYKQMFDILSKSIF